MKRLFWHWSYLVLTLLAYQAKGTVLYWDPENTATETATDLAATWDTSSGQWSATSAQSATPGAWVSGDAACFCAGSTTVSTPFTVTVNSAIPIAGIFNGSLASLPGVSISIGGSGSLSLVSGADAFDTAGAGSTTVAVPMTGPGQVALEGSRPVYFHGASTYSGGTQFGYPTVASFSSTAYFNNNQAFGTGPLQLSSSGGGSTMQSEGSVPITLANAFTAASINFNIVAASAPVSFTGPWNLAVTPNISCAGSPITISGVMSGAGGFTKYGTGTLVFSGANTFTGGTTLSNGVLSVTADNNLGTASSAANYNIFLDGGTLNASNSFTLNAKRLMLLSVNSVLSVSGGKTLTYPGSITGTAALTKSGAGTLVLTGASGYNGSTTIAGGTLEADSQGGGTTGTNAVLVQAGATLSGNGLISGPVSGTGSVAPGTAAGPATLSLGGGLNLSTGGTMVWTLTNNSTAKGFSSLSLFGGNLVLGGASRLSLNFTGTATTPNTNDPFWLTQEAWTVVAVSGSGSDSGNTRFTTLLNANYPTGTFTNYINGNSIVLLYKPSFPVFDVLYDGGLGFFSGEDLLLTNFSGLNLNVWSSTNAGLSLSNWTLVGPMQEQTLAPGQPGYSRYAINVNPTASPTYYMAGNMNTGPYLLSPVTCTVVTTADYQNFGVVNTNVDIGFDGVLGILPRPPVLVPVGAAPGSGFQLQFSGGSNYNYIIQASTDLTTWSNINYGTFSNPPVTFLDGDATNYPERFYRVVIP